MIGLFGIKVSLLAVFVSGVASMLLGSLWYGPLFGKQWMKLMGFTKSDMDKAKKKGMAKAYLINFAAALVMAFILAMAVSEATISGALILGFLIWIGFIATIMLGSVLWEGKSFSLYLLNVIYWLINIEVMSLILISLN